MSTKSKAIIISSDDDSCIEDGVDEECDRKTAIVLAVLPSNEKRVFTPTKKQRPSDSESDDSDVYEGSRYLAVQNCCHC